MLTVHARLELFKKNFPHEKIKSVQERNGENYEVLEINHTWMCKSAKTQEGIAALDREVKILHALQGKILTQIPEPLYYEENFLVYKKIPGSPLIAYTFFRYGNRQRSKLICDLVDFLLQWHSALDQEASALLGLTRADFPWSIEKLQENRHYLEDQKDLLIIFDNTMKMHGKALESEFKAALIHNNFSMNNIIVDSLTGRLRGVIDFTQVAYDDPALDFCWRHNNSLEFSKAIIFVYELINTLEKSSLKMYSYYFVTEFSRYFQYRQQGNIELAEKTIDRIVGSMQKFLSKHDNCTDEECQHKINQVQKNNADFVTV